MKKILFYLIGLLVTWPAVAQEGPPQASLFLTPQEEHEAEVAARRAAPAGKGDIRLGAVLYYGHDDWTLWLQGERWTPETSRPDLKVLEVSESGVRVLWNNPDDNKPVEILLRPNEAYQAGTGKIISEP